MSKNNEIKKAIQILRNAVKGVEELYKDIDGKKVLYDKEGAILSIKYGMRDAKNCAGLEYEGLEIPSKDGGVRDYGLMYDIFESYEVMNMARSEVEDYKEELEELIKYLEEAEENEG